MSRGFGKTTGRRTRISQSDDASASCSDSSQLDPPSVFSVCTVRFTTRSTFNATSSPDLHCGSSEPKRLRSGKMPSPRDDAVSLGSQSVLDRVAVTEPIRLIQATDRAPAGGPCARAPRPPLLRPPMATAVRRVTTALAWKSAGRCQVAPPRGCKTLDATTGPRRHDRPWTQCHAAMLARDANI